MWKTKKKRGPGFECGFRVDNVGLYVELCIYSNPVKVDFSLVSYSKHHICGDCMGKERSSGGFLGFMAGRTHPKNSNLGVDVVHWQR